MICRTCNGNGEINNAPFPDNSKWDNIGNCPDYTGKGHCPNCNTEWDNDTLDHYQWCIDNLHINKFVCPRCDWQAGGG